MNGVLKYRKADDVVMLNHAQLLRLARILKLREADLMSNLDSEKERIIYLTQVNGVHDKMVRVLTDAKEHRERYERQKNGAKAKIAKLAEEYVIYGANWAMQSVRNVCMRETCVEKLSDHFGALVTELKEVDQNNQSDVQDLAAKVNLFKDYMMEYGNATRSRQARQLSREYSESLMIQGISVPNLLGRTKTQLGFVGEFEDLEEEQKLQVYIAIINESKRAKLPELFNSSRKGGLKPGIGDKKAIAMLILNSSVLVYDIYTTPYNLERTVREVTKLIGTAAQIAVSIAVGSAVTAFTFNPVTGAIAASIAAFVAANIAGFLFTSLSGSLLDFIFGKGGSTAPVDLNTLKFHAGEMPDGMDIAYDIAHGKLLES